MSSIIFKGYISSEGLWHGSCIGIATNVEGNPNIKGTNGGGIAFKIALVRARM